VPLSAATTRLINAALYQAGWFACVLGAADGHGAAGAAVAAGLVGVHVLLSSDRRRDLGLMAGALALGVVMETGQIAGGTYASLGGTPPRALPPVWLLLLWVQFGTTFRYGLHPITSRPWRAVLFGAAGGPVAFLAGEALGAVVLRRPLDGSLAMLAAGWALAMALVAFARRGEATMAAPRYRWPGR
jgi:hypothetical protein